MSPYLLSCDAEKDLDNLWEFIAEDRAETADRLIGEIFATFEFIAQNPGVGHKREDLTTFPVLFWPVGNYLLIYRATGKLVEIVAIVHGKRDIPAFLRRRGVEE